MVEMVSVLRKSGAGAYKFKQGGVLSERSDTAGEAQDEHDPSNDDEEPHGVQAPEIGDG